MAAELCCDLGLSDVILEGDSLQVASPSFMEYEPKLEPLQADCRGCT
jgi:hypothetical protein